MGTDYGFLIFKKRMPNSSLHLTDNLRVKTAWSASKSTSAIPRSSIRNYYGYVQIPLVIMVIMVWCLLNKDSDIDNEYFKPIVMMVTKVVKSFVWNYHWWWKLWQCQRMVIVKICKITWQCCWRVKVDITQDEFDAASSSRADLNIIRT